MMEIDTEYQPDWFNDDSEEKKFKSGSVTSSSQLSVKSFLIPRLTKSEQTRIHHNLAMHYYMTGSSFQRIEEDHLLNAFKIARPDIKLPTRKELAGSLLDFCYEKIAKKTNTEMLKYGDFTCLVSDATSNVNNESVVNYMIIVGNKSFLIDTLYTESQSHTSDFIRDDMSRVINNVEKIGVKIAGAVTDNTAANKKAWLLLQKRYPSLYFHGCSSHGLHLLVKDIFAATKTKRGDQVGKYPEG
jgi:hypothetical protein